MKLLRLFMIACVIIILSTSAFSKGGTSGGSVVQPKVVEAAEPARPDCESFATIKERVACSLEFGQEKETTPEPCRVLPVAATCVKYYRDSVPCYEKDGKEKDKCFKDVLQFSKKSVKQQAKFDTRPLQSYMLLVLYDLEERVEEAVEDKELSVEDGAALITDIINLKIKVLERKPAAEIKAGLQKLKNKWPSEIK